MNNPVTLSHNNTFFRKIVWSMYNYLMCLPFLYVGIFHNKPILKIIYLALFGLTLFSGLLCSLSVKAYFIENTLFINGFFSKYTVELSNIKSIRRFFIYFYLIQTNDEKLFSSIIVIFASNNAMMTSTNEIDSFKARIYNKP